MPKLPSGRSIAVDASPFDDLLERARTEDQAALIILSIRSLLHALSLFNVIEIEERSDIPVEELALVSTPRGDIRCMTYETPYNASDIVKGCSDWPKSDVRAFVRFLRSRRLKKWMRDRYQQLVGWRKFLEEMGRLKSGLGEDMSGELSSPDRPNP